MYCNKYHSVLHASTRYIDHYRGILIESINGGFTDHTDASDSLNKICNTALTNKGIFT